MSLEKVTLLSIPKIPDERGNISFLQYPEQVPFEIKRVYWINDIPSGANGDGRASRHSQNIIIALSGSFEVVVNDGSGQRTFALNRPDVGLYVPAMIWRQLVNFSTNSVAFVTSSSEATQGADIFDLSQFQSMMQNGGKE